MDNLWISRTNHNDFWIKTKEKIKPSLPSHAYNTWFDPISSIALNEEELVLEVPNQFFFEWIQSHYSKIIQTTVREQNKKNIEVKYTLALEKGNYQRNNFDDQNIQTFTIKKQASEDKPKLNKNFTFSSFIEGANNQFAKPPPYQCQNLQVNRLLIH